MQKPERDEYRLLRAAFGPNWKVELINRLNVYDLTRQWPAYTRPDGLGIFSAAVLKKELPIIGHGKGAKKMTITKSRVYAPSDFLDPTQGIAMYLNGLLVETGLEQRVFKRKELIDLFLNFSQEFQRDLATVVLFSSVVNFYNQLSRDWLQWIGGTDEMSGKISPVTIWGNYAFNELWPQRDELETVIKMHIEEAANVFLEMQGNGLASQCVACTKPAKLQCDRCRVAVYCTPSCQRVDWPQHQSKCQ